MARPLRRPCLIWGRRAARRRRRVTNPASHSPPPPPYCPPWRKNLPRAAKASKPDVQPLGAASGGFAQPCLGRQGVRGGGFALPARKNSRPRKPRVTGSDKSPKLRAKNRCGGRRRRKVSRPEPASPRPFSKNCWKRAIPICATRRPGFRIARRGRKNPKAASVSSWCRNMPRRATSPTPSTNWSKA